MKNDVQLLGGDLASVEDHPSRSRSLPARAYTDPQALAAERELIFAREWLFVGHLSELRHVGDYITRDFADESVAVLRGEDGELRAFHNVCVHRGHGLLESSGNRRRLVCPYHAWSYGLDGCLKQVPGVKRMRDVNGGTISLARIQVDEIAGFVFINLDPGALGLERLFPGFRDGLQEQFPELDALQFLGEFEVPYEANWKVDVDNYLECYHCGPAHPSFRSIFEYEHYTIETFEFHQRVTAPSRCHPDSAYLISPDVHPKDLCFWYLWPNTAFNLFPGIPQISVQTFEPIAPDRSAVRLKVYSTGADVQAPAGYTRLGLTVLEEDKALCESVQRGMRSRSFVQGRYVVPERRPHLSEHGVHHFHRLISGRLAEEPERRA